VLAAQRGDRQRSVEHQRTLHVPGSLDPFTELLCFRGRLVDHGTAIDDVYEPAGKGRAAGPRNEPDRHCRGLAQTSRDVQRRRDLASSKSLEQILLPREG
jgi:hypothetical protein